MMKRTVILILALSYAMVYAEESTLDEKIARFYEWSSLKGIVWNNIQVKEIPNFGLGIEATNDIKAGDLVLSVPISAMLIPKNADEKMSQVWEAVQITPTNKVAMHLIYEKNKQTSHWGPYIDLLPKSFSTPIYWTENELLALQKSKLREKAVIRRETIEKQHEKVFTPLFYRFPRIFNPIKFSSAEVKWGLSVVWSRAFHVDTLESADSGLVPFADFFNNVIATKANDNIIKVDTQITGGALEFYATGFIRKGEQIFTPYGKNKRLSNAQLLLDYGFAVPGNIHDMVVYENPLIFTNPDKPDPLLIRKKAFAEKVGLLRPEIYVYRGEYEELLKVMRIHLMVSAEIPNDDAKIESFIRGERVSARNEKAVVRTLISEVSRMMSEYPTTLHEDKSLYNKHNLSENKKQAIAIRMGEKTILLDLRNWLEKQRDFVPQII